MCGLLKKYKSYLLRQNFYGKLINKNDLCFDIGANVGFKSKTMLRLGAIVIAFEPQSTCYSSLEKIKNKNFKFHQFAVGSKNGISDLNLSNHSAVATLSQQFIDYYETDAVQWNSKESVEVRTLDSLIEEFGIPDFCKIDVEGFELEILSSLSYAIPIIEFEFTSGFIPETIQIIDTFDKENSTFNFTLNEKPKFESVKWKTGEEIAKTISSLPKAKLHGNIFVKNNLSKNNTYNSVKED